MSRNGNTRSIDANYIGPADGEPSDGAVCFVPELIVVVPCRASLFDGGCIGDSQRRLFIEEKRNDVAYLHIG
jgi:hypothetical protein